MIKLLHIWSWNWSFALLSRGLLLMLVYIWLTDFKNTEKIILFGAGLILAELALALPLGPVPTGYQRAGVLSCALPGGTLFSLHMLRHIMLLMLAPPLMVAGLPEQPLRRLLSRRPVKTMVKKCVILSLHGRWEWGLCGSGMCRLSSII